LRFLHLNNLVPQPLRNAKHSNISLMNNIIPTPTNVTACQECANLQLCFVPNSIWLVQHQAQRCEIMICKYYNLIMPHNIEIKYINWGPLSKYINLYQQIQEFPVAYDHIVLPLVAKVSDSAYIVPWEERGHRTRKTCTTNNGVPHVLIKPVNHLISKTIMHVTFITFSQDKNRLYLINCEKT